MFFPLSLLLPSLHSSSLPHSLPPFLLSTPPSLPSSLSFFSLYSPFPPSFLSPSLHVLPSSSSHPPSPPPLQGPCVQNQEALARSRLLDAVSGFLHIFAIFQRKLYRDTSQVELLRELLGLQEEMFILLLSMLEGQDMGWTN